MLELVERAEREVPVNDTLTLSYEQRQKMRQRVRLDSGQTAALVLPSGAPLEHGDRLRAIDGTVVEIAAAAEEVSTARTDDPLRLARACYHLGNRHVPLQVGPGWVRFQPDHVLEDMVENLGLAVTHGTARFEPERGAYHGQTHVHQQERRAGHADHAHTHAHQHGHRH
jgi:urease accessory protein